MNDQTFKTGDVVYLQDEMASIMFAYGDGSYDIHVRQSGKMLNRFHNELVDEKDYQTDEPE